MSPLATVEVANCSLTDKHRGAWSRAVSWQCKQNGVDVLALVRQSVDVVM